VKSEYKILVYICLSKECYYKLIIPELNSHNIFGFYLGCKWVDDLFGQGLHAGVIELCRLVPITTGILAKIPYREIRTGPTGTRTPPPLPGFKHLFGSQWPLYYRQQ